MEPISPLEAAVLSLANAIWCLASSGSSVFGTRDAKTASDMAQEAVDAIREHIAAQGGE